MATILCISDGMLSVVYPALELSRRLAADGHSVVFAGAPQQRPTVEALELQFRPLPTSQLAEERRNDAALSFIESWGAIDRRRGRFLSSLHMDAVVRILQESAADLILIDGELHEHLLVALGASKREQGPRVVGLNSFASIWRGAEVPPPHVLVRPGIGWRGSSTGIALSWQALRWRKRARRLHHWFRDRGCDRVSLLRRMARDSGLALGDVADPGQWLIPFTYRIPFFSLHALEFEFPHQPPSHVRYVGPMLLRSRPQNPATDLTPRDEIAAFETMLAELPENRPIVYATFGSTLAASRGLLRKLVQVGATGEWTIVLSLGTRLDPAEFGSLPDGVHAFRWVPQLRLLERATLAIVHGGINTIDECVANGVPMLVACGHQTDMAGNAMRVVHHGIGMLAEPEDDAETLRIKLRRLIEDSTYQTRILRLRDQYLEYERSKTLERTVRDLLRPSEWQE